MIGQMAISIPLRSVTPIFILMDSRFCTVFVFPQAQIATECFVDALP